MGLPSSGLSENLGPNSPVVAPGSGVTRAGVPWGEAERGRAQVEKGAGWVGKPKVGRGALRAPAVAAG